VKARFVPQGGSADAAIMARLARLGGEARNWTVVSSDRQVIAAARARQAASLSSADFAARLVQTLSEAPQGADAETGMELSEAEIGEWLELFGGEER
jgi:hypothetical protein